MIKGRTIEVLEEFKKVISALDESQLESFMNELIKVNDENKKVFCIAAGRANLCIRALSMRLMQMGFSSYMVFDTCTPAIAEGDLLIACSGSGKTESTIMIADQAKKKNARVIAITKDKNSKLAQKADNVLVLSTKPITKKLQTNGSEFEQILFIMNDNICVELMLRLGFIPSIDEIDKFIMIRHANLQ